LRDDEERAFEEFVERTADRLLRSAVLLTGDRAAGEDLLQGALERTGRHWHRIGAEAPEAYIRRALVNAATSRWRRRRFHEVPLLVDATWTADARVVDAAEVLSQRDELIRGYRHCSPRQRAVICCATWTTSQRPRSPRRPAVSVTRSRAMPHAASPDFGRAPICLCHRRRRGGPGGRHLWQPLGIRPGRHPSHGCGAAVRGDRPTAVNRSIR